MNLSEYHFDRIFTTRLNLRLSQRLRTLVNMGTGDIKMASSINYVREPLVYILEIVFMT